MCVILRLEEQRCLGFKVTYRPSLPGVRVSEAGVLVKSYVDRGILVPDDIMTRLMLPKLEQLSAHSWLLDGESNITFLVICVWIKHLSFVCAFWSLSQLFQLLCGKIPWGLGNLVPATPQLWLARWGPAPRPAEPNQDRTQIPDQEADFRPDAGKWNHPA